ncbi:hypothetical protein CQY20_12380 [Mycolicibacterium agri]|uniref:DUF3566 domain-containing protein n=1 Tax=Mycolicibacterium agri TaxID=36811 RepID=A0A2A7N5P9_MYCAG|nr:DUF3566 domain-containing protein [Mycolicibacterium agri]PEG38758.1 hypothetical protein CQY20_12380 [Mycolicibacterium agri]GFG53391.1 hypothetical protein MAGR_48320 [Mycolicibacterium agri]
MTSPNEAGYPRSADGSANGSLPDDSETGSLGNAVGRGEAPPWQRGPAARAQQQGARPPREQARPEPHRGPGQSGHAPGDRLNRFISGGGGGASSAQDGAEQAPLPRNESPRNESPRNEQPRPEPPVAEAYASELPDLSGPTPRPQRKSTPDREPVGRLSPAGRVQVASRTHTGPVRASMQIRRIDPWSALKVSLVLSVALFFVWMIAVAFLYLVLGGMGVWSKLNSNVGDLLTSASGQAGGELVSSGTIFGGAALIGLVNIVLLTAMATVGVFIYNLTTDLVGGIEVTLADRD